MTTDRSGRKLRITIRFKLWNKGEMIQCTTLRKKSQVVLRSEANTWDKAYINVIYGRDMSNESYHTNIESLKKALSSYTEKNLLDYIYA